MSISTVANRTLAEQAVTILNHSNSSANAGTTTATTATATAKGSPGKTDRGPAAIVDISALSATFESIGKIPTRGQSAAYAPPGESVDVETRSELAGKVVEHWASEGKPGYTVEQFVEKRKEHMLIFADVDERDGRAEKAAAVREMIATRTPKVMRPSDVPELNYKSYGREVYNSEGHLIESSGMGSIDPQGFYKELCDQGRLQCGGDEDFGDFVIIWE